ncbi:MAG: ribosome silencing factor [Bacteroidales bacterium]|jgi:ribosome-associated protein|nr:ribosome silencing factor [Bacteroidales bacterium]
MTKVKEREKTKELADCIIEAMQEKMAQDIVVIDFSELSNMIADYFIICHAGSSPQMEAIADAIERKTRTALKSRPWSHEGFENKEWMLLDYVDVVVHIFREDRRQFYNIEGLWADAIIKKIDQE